MSCLIFCSFEVGGFPFRMAETLNRLWGETYYVYVGPKERGHDSKEFHYGEGKEVWDLSDSFQGLQADSRAMVRVLKELKLQYKIKYSLATGSGSFLLHEAGIPYFYWSYGADLDQQCSLFSPFNNYPLWKRLFLHPSRVWKERERARASILRAHSVMISPYQVKALLKIGNAKKMFFLPHFFRLMDYDRLLGERRRQRKALCEQFRADRFFFSSTRHVWSGPLRSMTDYKANDLILHAYSRYVQAAGDLDSKILLVKKGPDVESSGELARRLRIDRNLIWVDEMTRDQLNRFYQGADLCFGQFGTPVLTYASLEPLSNACGGISYFGKEEPDVPFYQEPPPILNSKDPGEMASLMGEILNSEASRMDLGYRSWLWIKEKCSEERLVASFDSLSKELQ